MRKRIDLQLIGVIGSRMREAREIAGMQQIHAAKLLGYQNSSRLNKIENATNVSSISLHIILTAAKIYDVSTDFLLGSSDEWERNARVAGESNAMSHILELWNEQHLNDLNAIRKNENKVKALCGAVESYSNSVMHCRKSLNIFMDRNKGFNDMKAGATLVNAVCGLENAVYNSMAQLKRYKADVKVDRDLRHKQLGVFD
jgi:transcriptional regulator with XRE-family HTH domain